MYSMRLTVLVFFITSSLKTNIIPIRKTHNEDYLYSSCLRHGNRLFYDNPSVSGHRILINNLFKASDFPELISQSVCLELRSKNFLKTALQF